MPLITLEHWLQTTYDADSAPSIGTVRQWAKKGHIPAIKCGRAYYVEIGARYSSTPAPQAGKPTAQWRPDFSAIVAGR
jgi:hypothetical protein